MGAESGRPERLVTLSPQALADYAATYAYTAHYWGEAQAERYTSFLEGRFQALVRGELKSAPVAQRSGLRMVSVRWKSGKHGHRLFFREVETGIYVLRILHTAMDWPTMLDGE